MSLNYPGKRFSAAKNAGDQKLVFLYNRPHNAQGCDYQTLQRKFTMIIRLISNIQCAQMLDMVIALRSLFAK